MNTIAVRRDAYQRGCVKQCASKLTALHEEAGQMGEVSQRSVQQAVHLNNFLLGVAGRKNNHVGG